MQRRWGRFSTVVLAVTAVLACAARAGAGVVIVTESETPDAAQKGAPAAKPKPKSRGAETRYKGQLYVEGDRVRMHGTSSDAEGVVEGTVIFRAKPEALLVLNDDEKSYFEITRADAQRIGSAIDTARSQMQAQLEKMPPEQRAMIEQAMEGMGAGALAKAAKPRAPLEPARAVASGGSDTVGAYACRGYDIVRGGKKIAEACVASWSDLGLAPADVDGLRKLAAFQQQMFAEVNWEGMDAAPGAEAFEVMEQINGFPVRVRSIIAGKPPVVMRVVKVERRDLEPTLFQPPAGYAKGAPPME